MKKIIFLLINFFIQVVVFLLFVPIYAGVHVGTLEMPCMKKSGYPTIFTYPADPKAQLSFVLEGIKLEGQEQLADYDISILHKEMLDKSREERSQRFNELKAAGRIILPGVNVIVNVYCGARDKHTITSMNMREAVVCIKGEGLLAELYSPHCYAEEGEPYSAGIFTLTVVRDEDEETTAVKQAVAVSHQNGVPEKQDLPNGRQEPAAARATPENGTTTAQQRPNGVTENDRLVPNGLHGDPDATGDKRSCCLCSWRSS